MSAAPSWLAVRLLEANLLPDAVIRAGIRRIVTARLRRAAASTGADELRRPADGRSRGPIAVADDLATGVGDMPVEFYRLVLGRHLKYSSAWWDDTIASLDDAEARMLAVTIERADIRDGHRVLDLGCGWGSLALWLARRCPSSEIVGVSNSAPQKTWIDEQARTERLENVSVVMADMNTFEASGTFDRIVSVEMFEHMSNWRALLGRARRWLRDDGRLFLQVFTHDGRPYPGAARGSSSGTTEYFFSGDMVPSDRLIDEFSDLFAVEDRWQMDGSHYARTANAWLANMDRHRAAIWPLLESTYGTRDAKRWWVRWRVFFMACAELWGHGGGDRWTVSHYRLQKAASGGAEAPPYECT